MSGILPSYLYMKLFSAVDVTDTRCARLPPLQESRDRSSSLASNRGFLMSWSRRPYRCVLVPALALNRLSELQEGLVGEE
jgi:hypothetical protein